MVLAEMYGKHRWSMRDFIYHLVTAEPIQKNEVSCSVRTKSLSNALCEQQEVVEQLDKASKDIRIVCNTELVTRLRSELHAVGKPEVGLGEFDTEKEIDTLGIPALAERIQKAAPELWALLAGLWSNNMPAVVTQRLNTHANPNPYTLASSVNSTSIEMTLILVNANELLRGNCTLDWPSRLTTIFGNGCERFCTEALIDVLLGGLSRVGRAMDCGNGEGEAGRSSEEQVRIRRSKA